MGAVAYMYETEIRVASRLPVPRSHHYSAGSDHRQLFQFLLLNRAPHHFLRLNAGARGDLMWWQTFLQDWNVTLFFPSYGVQLTL